MAQSRQTPRVWSDAICGSEILANFLLVAGVGGFWFLEGITSLDRRLWVHHVANGVGLGGRIAELPNLGGSATRIQVPEEQVRRYTWRSYETVSRRLQESLFLGSCWPPAGRSRPPISCARAAARRPGSRKKPCPDSALLARRMNNREAMHIRTNDRKRTATGDR